MHRSHKFAKKNSELETAIWKRLYLVFAIILENDTLLKAFWQNSPAANLLYKLTNAKHFVSPNFQELKIIPENNFLKFPEWLHILDKDIVSLHVPVYHSFAVQTHYASLPLSLGVFCNLRFS